MDDSVSVGLAFALAFIVFIFVILFFHFIPKGTAELCQPENWTRLFGVPELLREVSAEDR